ncbi:SDR family NAD(P)-dependent oxidoreductase [Novosphingobium sp. ZW T3_23]|uniref:SDR family NAD(P)-dependent oxidoreductase n=1 Tax=Novosphingobium sp. ZW T3_23 TaxID=3378084 RepID=UPI003851F51E
MDLELDGRRTLVTGSSSGIGEGIARVLAREGCKVVVHGRHRERAEKVAAEIGAAGVALGDLSTDAGAQRVHEQAVAALGGPIEILVNNAGGSSTDSTTRPPLDVKIEEWLDSYNGNTLSSVRLALLAAPSMVEAGWGRLIQISSAVSLQPNGLGPDYSGAKAALNNFTVSLAGSLRNSGVTVNTVTPGVIMMDSLLQWGRAQFGDAGMSVADVTRHMAEAGIFELPPAGRLGTPDDIAHAVCMLASPRAGFVTGSNYRVDGGQVRAVL